MHPPYRRSLRSDPQTVAVPYGAQDNHQDANAYKDLFVLLTLGLFPDREDSLAPASRRWPHGRDARAALWAAGNTGGGSS